MAPGRSHTGHPHFRGRLTSLDSCSERQPLCWRRPPLLLQRHRRSLSNGEHLSSATLGGGGGFVYPEFISPELSFPHPSMNHIPAYRVEVRVKHTQVCKVPCKSANSIPVLAEGTKDERSRSSLGCAMCAVLTSLTSSSPGQGQGHQRIPLPKALSPQTQLAAAHPA